MTTFLTPKKIGRVRRKERGKASLPEIKDLTNISSKITKIGSSHYEGFCETNVLENYIQSLQRLVKEFSIWESYILL